MMIILLNAAFFLYWIIMTKGELVEMIREKNERMFVFIFLCCRKKKLEEFDRALTKQKTMTANEMKLGELTESKVIFS
jgi:hypothetical protein